MKFLHNRYADGPQSATDIDIGDTSFSLTRRTDLPGLARPAPSAKKTKGSEPR
jgi:hypothetical protein